MNWEEIVYHDYFSGVGGFAFGILQAGVKFKEHYFSEIDKHAIAVYKYHFNEAKEVGNIKSFSGDGASRPNLITFGFPCQDLSIAGRRKGIAGKRSGLFFQALRLIEKYLPEAFIFENVAGLLSSNEGKDFEIVLQAIADIGLYDCEWQLVNTRWVLPQNRERIYFVGHLRGTGGFRVFPFKENDGIFTKKSPGSYNEKLPCILATEYKGPSRQRCQNLVIQKTSGQTVTAKFDETGTLQAGDANVMDKVANTVTPDAYLATGERKRDENNKAVLTSQHERRIRRLTPVECERLQGFPDGYTEYGDYNGVIKKVSNTQRYKMMGNAVTTIWPTLILKRIMYGING